MSELEKGIAEGLTKGITAEPIPEISESIKKLAEAANKAVMTPEKRLIDIGKRMEEWQRLLNAYFPNMPCQTFYQFILSSPTVDAVEVVRCKDCKHWTYDNYHKHNYCSNKFGLRYVCPENNFCSYGERREGE